MIAEDGIDAGGTGLAFERREVLVAIDLVASGAASRVVVAGLAHARELVVRMSARARIAGVVLADLPSGGPVASVLVRARPPLVAGGLTGPSGGR